MKSKSLIWSQAVGIAKANILAGKTSKIIFNGKAWILLSLDEYLKLKKKK